jgi:uncharacterized protein (DUF849 family)
MLETYSEGARYFHVHARNPNTGVQFANLQWYQAVLDGARAQIHPRLPFGVATSRKGEEVEATISAIREAARRRHGGAASVDDWVEGELARAVGIHACPDAVTSFTAPEILAGRRSLARAAIAASLASYPAHVRWTKPEIVRGYYRRLREWANRLSVRQEFEITTAEAYSAIEDIASDSSLGIDRCLHVVFLFGFSSRLPISREAYEVALGWVESLRQATGVDARISVGVVIPPHRAAAHPRTGGSATAGSRRYDYEQVLAWVLEDDRVDAFRVGLEDTPVLYGKPRSNAWLVRHARTLVQAAGVTVETDVSMVRARLGLKP